MENIKAKEVQKLRKAAGAGMMDAKEALIDAGGDFEQAFELLRERGQAKMVKRADREASEGTIGAYIHEQNDRPVMGVLVLLACETDFVAKSEEFRQVAVDIAMHVSWGDPAWTTRDEVDEEVLGEERALIARQAVAEGKPEQAIDRIVEGKIEAWYTENVLYDQAFVNADRYDGTVGEMVAVLAAKMGENISVRKIARIAVGE